MSQLDPVQRAACEELVLGPGHVFSVVHRFLPGPGGDRELALQALFQTLRTLPWTATDAAVTRAKLAWWHDALMKANQEPPQHPLVQALAAGGALDDFDARIWDSYIGALAQRVGDSAWERVSDLERYLRLTGRCEESWLTGAPGNAASDAPGSSRAALGMLELLESPWPWRRWMPLELVARHAVGDPGVDAGGPEGWHGAVSELAALALQWLPRPGRTPKESGVGKANTTAQASLAIGDAVVARRLRRVGRPPRPRPGDVLAAWRAARRTRLGPG